MSEKILDIKEERLSFFTPAGEVKALNGVSFAMNQGDVLGIVGESGSGKSVTAYSVMGLTAYPGKLVGGTVWFNGHEIEKMKEKDTGSHSRTHDARGCGAYFRPDATPSPAHERGRQTWP